MRRRRLLAGIAAASALALSLTACGGGRAGVQGEQSEPGGNKGALIGVAMPTKTSERWIDDGDNVKAKLEACLLYTSPSPRDRQRSRMPSSA